MNRPHRHSNGIPVNSARELVALTVVIHRWHRDYLQALAREQACSPSTVLRVLLDRALGPAPEEAAPPDNDERSQDEPDELALDRSIRLQPRHREVLAAIANRRALPVSSLLGAIVDAWIQANMDACD
jgi:hypothetical protein